MAITNVNNEKTKDLGSVELNDFLIFIGSICESGDEKSKSHIERMQQNTSILAESLMSLFPKYRLTKEKCEQLSSAAAFHDIGKLKIPQYILNKPTKLTAEEFQIIQKHPLYGVHLLDLFITKPFNNNIFIDYLYEICLNHHERYDGKGYPNHLFGDDIPISGQIVGILDVYDALLHSHVYRGAYDKKDTLNMIITGKCGAFNPDIIEAFKKSELYNI